MLAFLFCFLLLSSHSTASFGEATKSVSGFSIDLIHRDSPWSPFYNPSLTPSEITKNAALRSIARSKHLSLSKHKIGTPKTITISDVAIGEYLMRFYIGTPPVETLAVADTGSDLIWVQCSPCKKCSPQNTPLFDPTESSTFRTVSCDSQPCTLLSQTQTSCTKSGECMYNYAYGDNTFTDEKLGVDKINFGSKGVQFPKFTFACAYYNEELPDKSKMKTGLVGLGKGPLSLFSQLADKIGNKFSYCLIPYGLNATGKLKFGDDETPIRGKEAVSTPLIIKSSQPSFYYVNFEGISIGENMVKMSKSETYGNMFIDSGTTFTMLEHSFYSKFVTLVKKVSGAEVVKNPPAPYDFCLSGEDTKNVLLKYTKNNNSDEDDDNILPDVVFHFTGGAKIKLNFLPYIFNLVDGNLCMLIHPANEDGFNILGNVQQMGYQVEYDLGEGKVSFSPADCAKY